MLKKLLSFSLFTFLLAPLCSMVLAQGTLMGTVTDAEEETPLPGATVQVPSLAVGQTTDAEGNYVITGLEPGTYVVNVGFLGYLQFEEEVTIADGEEQVLDISLEPDILGLDEIVAVGYGLRRKRDITGSISSISAEDFERQSIQTADQALQGRVSGVRVTSSSGQPGGGVNVRVRGTGSITAGNDPLYIIDGVQVTSEELGTLADGNPLNSLRPGDIESIEVLKDGAAASIYGAQASNGVVLITTRRGVEGRTEITVNSQFGYTEDPKRFDIIEGPEWVELMIEAEENRASDLGLSEAATEDAIQNRLQNDFGVGDPRAGDEIQHYDWQDELMRSGLRQNYGITARGGTEATRFYISAGYDQEDGTAIATDYERYALRSNFDHDATDRLSLELNTNLSTSMQTGTLDGGFFLGSPFYAGQRNRPIDPIYNDDGSFNQSTFNNYNVVEANELDDREERTNQLVGNLALNYNLTDELFLRSTIGSDYRQVRSNFYSPPGTTSTSGFGGLGWRRYRQVLNVTTNHTMNYIRTFDDIHSVNALVGGEYRQENRELFLAEGSSYPSGLFRTLQNAATAENVTGYGSEFRLAGAFTRAEYTYDDRYSATLTLRRDGSSRFGEDNQWGTFYSGSVGWDISQEDFLSDVGFIDELRPRFSYGVTGNTSGISNFQARQLYGSGGSYDGQPSLRPTGLGNNLLTWEEARNTNLGLDFTFLEGRLYGTFELFRTTNDELLLDRSLPGDGGFGDVTDNIGEIRNEGLEIEVGVIPVDVGGFTWTTDFNISFFRNEVMQLVDDEDFITVDGTRYEVGQPVGMYYMYEYAGVNPASGKPMFYDADGDITYRVSTSNPDDRRKVGTTEPDFFGGWSNSFSYRGLNLDILFQFNYGQYVYNSMTGSFTDGAFWRRGGLIENSRNRWTEPGQMTTVERANTVPAYEQRSSGFIQSTRFLEDASYIRLKNIQLSYDLPPSLVNNIGLGGASIFVEGTNLLTWTEYSLIDPEIVSDNNVVYPQPRLVTSGIQLQF